MKIKKFEGRSYLKVTYLSNILKMESICLPSEVNVSELKVGNLKTLGNGGKMGFINNKDKSWILQCPEMWAPFGLNEYSNDDGTAKYSINLSFKNLEDRPALQEFMKFLTELDEKVVNTALENSQKWFGKKYTNKEVVEALYTPCVNYPKDKETGEIITKYAPTVKVNLPQRDGEFRAEVYDQNKDRADLKKMTTKGAKVVGLLQCGGVWVIGGKFGVTWRGIQLQVTPQSTISGFSIKAVEGDRIEVDDNIDDATTKVNGVSINDSDEDDDN